MVSFGVDGCVPLYQNLNGLQMKIDWHLTAGLQTQKGYSFTKLHPATYPIV